MRMQRRCSFDKRIPPESSSLGFKVVGKPLIVQRLRVFCLAQLDAGVAA